MEESKRMTSAKAKEALLKDNEDKCCGGCCWFRHEDTDGSGLCSLNYGDYGKKSDDLPWKMCFDNGCDEYLSRQQMRHYMAVLLQTNRYRRDQNVPAWHRMPNPTELGKAIDAAYKYYKIMEKYNL